MGGRIIVTGMVGGELVFLNEASVGSVNHLLLSVAVGLRGCFVSRYLRNALDGRYRPLADIRTGLLHRVSP